jgi:hypothetical protein
MEQDVEIVPAVEPVFELHEVPGPAFALKQQGDRWQDDNEEI